MKDQTNLIIIVVAIVFMIGFTLAFALGARKPVILPAPPAVPVADVAPAEGAVVYGNSLPNAGSGGGSAFGGGGSRAGGGPSLANDTVGGGGSGPTQASRSRAVGSQR